MKKENIIIAAFLGLLVVAAIIMLTQKKAVVTNPNGTTGSQTANSLGGSIADFFGGLFKPSTTAPAGTNSGSSENWFTDIFTGKWYDYAVGYNDGEINYILATDISINPENYGLNPQAFWDHNPGLDGDTTDFESGVANTIMLPSSVYQKIMNDNA